MTLLSIREQEAVKAARERFIADFCLVSWLTMPEMGYSDTEARPALDSALDALILATRDAIARQVRDHGDVRPTDSETRGFWCRVANFIEGLPL